VDRRRRRDSEVLGVVDAERHVCVSPTRTTELTLPTSTPATLTVSPGWSPDAFVNSAKYPVAAFVFKSSKEENTIDVNSTTRL